MRNAVEKFIVENKTNPRHLLLNNSLDLNLIDNSKIDYLIWNDTLSLYSYQICEKIKSFIDNGGGMLGGYTAWADSNFKYNCISNLLKKYGFIFN